MGVTCFAFYRTKQNFSDLPVVRLNNLRISIYP